MVKFSFYIAKKNIVLISFFIALLCHCVSGCYFHGCSSCYPNQDTVNAINGLTMGELLQRTRLTTMRMESRGYEVIEKWECSFREDIKKNNELSLFYQQYQPYTQMNPRDAFYGGRTNAIMLFYEAQENERISYVDFTSLYPWVCKYGLFPLGHPNVYFADSIPEKQSIILLLSKVSPI